MGKKGGKRKKIVETSGGDDDDGEQPDTEANQEEEPQVKAPKISGGSSPKLTAAKASMQAPDAAEVLEIARTQNLFKSNLFRMQLEELLREVAPRSAHPKLEGFLRGLQPILRSLKAREIPETFEAEFPALFFHQRKPNPLAFKAPNRIDVVGSFLLGTCPRSHPCVDLTLEMPSEAFYPKDYLNFRYSDKRAAYVGEVFKQLQALQDEGNEHLAGVKLFLGCLHGDAYRPCVVLRLGAGKAESSSWTVRLLPSYAADLWPAARLGPDRNAVRPEDWTGDDAAVQALPPTPQYNSCVLEDARMRSHLETLHKAAQKMPALKEGILLLKRWSLARGFLAPANGKAVCAPLNGFCLSMLAAHAGQTSSVAPSQTSSFQLFKLALSLVANTDWASQKLVFGKASCAALSEHELKAGGAHFYDADGFLNFFSRLGSFITEIRWEAQRALRILDTTADPYEAVFGMCTSPELSWDLVVRTPPLGAAALCPGAKKSVTAASEPGVAALLPAIAADEPPATALGAQLAAILSAGLGDRCIRLGVRLVADQGATWDKEESDRRPADGPAILVGLSLEASNLDRSLDRGPQAQESKEAARFRSLWGQDKAELRRFKDGSILECAVWKRPPAERPVESRKQPAVMTQVLRHLLQRHFGDISAETEIVAGPLGFVSNLADKDRRLWQTFENFRTHLSQLSSLPLTIKDVHPESSAFSYSDVASTIAPVAADGIERTLHGVVVEFESSGRWPDNADAVRRVCTALMLQMKEEFQTELGIESGVTEDYLDVRYPEFVFRLTIFHQHELSATAHRVTNFQAQLNSPPPTAEAVRRLRNLWWKPRIRSSMHGHVLQKPALAGAVRLFKRWLASQMLSGYEDFAEHIIASVFLQPLPFDTPTSAQSGFCRACWLLSSFDWHREPLVVDFDGKLSDDERLAMRRSFEAGRAEAAGADTFWISSRFDPHAMLLETPPATACTWLKRRARQALSFYHQRLLSPAQSSGAGGWQQLFAVDTSVFDIVVRLNAPGTLESGAPKAARRRAWALRESAIAFVEKLQKNLSSVCLVFYDAGNHVVALKWRPGAFLPQPQHVLMGAVPHTMVARPDQQKQPLCVPNVLYITSTIAALADGLAVDVKVAGGAL